jgi:uncharacterized membrane protein
MLRKITIAIMAIAGFVFFASLVALHIQTQLIELGVCPIPIPIVIPVIASIGIFVGSFVYYIMAGKIEETREKRMETINRLLQLLPADEREIIKKIIENKGKITQSKLSSIFGKVKVFRIVENLRKRGIIEKKKYGKTNLIELNENYMKVLL